MTEKNLVIVATLGAIPLPMPHLFCRFPTALVPFLIFERETTFPYLSEPQCTQLAVAQLSPKERRESYAETHRQPDMVSVQTQTGSELPDLLTCTTLHSNDLQNSSTHSA
jgi:hypothetical protein